MVREAIRYMEVARLMKDSMILRGIKGRQLSLSWLKEAHWLLKVIAPVILNDVNKGYLNSCLS